MSEGGGGSCEHPRVACGPGVHEEPAQGPRGPGYGLGNGVGESPKGLHDTGAIVRTVLWVRR